MSYKKIDIHQHANPIEYLPDGTIAPNMATGKPSKATTDEEVMHYTLEYMDKHNIQKSVISWTLEYVYRWMDYAPDRFIPGVLIFEEPFPDSEHLRDEIKAGNIRFMGEICAQYSGVKPNDPRLEPYFALAEEFDLSVHIHCAGIGPPVPTWRIKNGNPLLLEDVVSKHRDLRIFVENAGYPFLQEITGLMMMYPNVYADLSTISWLIP